MEHVQYAASIVALAHHIREIPQPDPHTPEAIILATRALDLLRSAETALQVALRTAGLPADDASAARHVQRCPHGTDYGTDYAPMTS